MSFWRRPRPPGVAPLRSLCGDTGTASAYLPELVLAAGTPPRPRRTPPRRGAFTEAATWGR